jgi:hypothetical protein
MKIRGTNFQAWAEFELDATGFTVLIGPSNIGKSAIFRLIKATLRNELTPEQIRTGTDMAEATIEVAGKTITAKRRKKTVDYTVNSPEYEKPKEYAKLNKKIPEPVKDLKFGEIELGDIHLDPIFAPQFGSQFLLEATPQIINAVLGAFSATEKLETGKREANNRIREGDAAARTLAVEIQDAESRSAKLEVLLEPIAAIEAFLNAEEPEITRLTRRLEVIDSLTETLDRIAALRQVIARIEIPSTIEAETSAQVAAAAAAAAIAAHRYGKLHGLAKHLDIEVPEQLPTLRETIVSADSLIHARHSLAANAAVSATIDDLVTAWSEYVGLFQRMRALDEAVDTLGPMQQRPTRQTTVALAALLSEIEDGDVSTLVAVVDQLDILIESTRRHEAAAGDMSAMDEDLRGHDVELAIIHGAQRAAEVNLITCPDCGAKFKQSKEAEHKEKKHGRAA